VLLLVPPPPPSLPHAAAAAAAAAVFVLCSVGYGAVHANTHYESLSDTPAGYYISRAARVLSGLR
jgi:hypothetical protein